MDIKVKKPILDTPLKQKVFAASMTATLTVLIVAFFLSLCYYHDFYVQLWQHIKIIGEYAIIIAIIGVIGATVIGTIWLIYDVILNLVTT